MRPLSRLAVVTPSPGRDHPPARGAVVALAGFLLGRIPSILAGSARGRLEQSKLSRGADLARRRARGLEEAAELAVGTLGGAGVGVSSVLASNATELDRLCVVVASGALGAS
jgi:hypothetical protein